MSPLFAFYFLVWMSDAKSPQLLGARTKLPAADLDLIPEALQQSGQKALSEATEMCSAAGDAVAEFSVTIRYCNE